MCIPNKNPLYKSTEHGLKFLFLLIMLVGSNQSYSQELITSENFTFRFIKAKKAKGGNYNYTIKAPKSMNRVQIRFKMKSLSEKKENFDPNKFYLVSDGYKKRIKPIDITHNYAAGWIFIGFGLLIDREPSDKTLKQWFSYKPQIVDTFKDFQIDGYDDIVPSINFGTKRNPKYFSPYLDHKDLKSCKIDLYFSLPKELKSFKIFYGNTLIANTSIK